MDRRPEESPGQQAHENSPVAQGPRRGRGWMIGLGCVLLGAALGALLFAVVVRPLLGGPGHLRAVPGYDRSAPEEALVAAAVSTLEAAPDEWISITWLVTNTGKTRWPVDLYYFSPQESDLPVVSLPRSVSPGEEVVIRVFLQAPPEPRGWEPVWALRGRRGAVPGGTLRVHVSMRGL